MGNRAYVTNGLGGYPLEGNTLQIFDTTDPLRPTSLGTAQTDRDPVGVAVKGNYAYVINRDGFNLQTFDVSKPSSPRLVSTVETDHNPSSLSIDGNTLAVVNYQRGILQLFDLSTPSRPVLVGSATTEGNPRFVLARDKAIYAESRYGIDVFDASVPASPTLVSNVGDSYINALVAQDQYLYASSSISLQIFDISSPLQPKVMGEAYFASMGLDIQGRYAYLFGNNPPSLQVIDVSNSQQPQAANCNPTSVSSSSFSSSPPTTTSFSDVPTDAWYSYFVQQTAEAGIITGYQTENGRPTGMFGPERNVTIAEALKIALESAGFEYVPNCSDCYAAHYPLHWATKYVNAAQKRGMGQILFTPSGEVPTEPSIRPSGEFVSLDRPATRAEVTAMFAWAFEWASAYPVSSPDPLFFNDVTGSGKFDSLVDVLAMRGIVWGDVDSSGNALARFRPNDPINRAEVAKISMLARIVKQSLDFNIEYSSDTGFDHPIVYVNQGAVLSFSHKRADNEWGEVWLESSGKLYPGFAFDSRSPMRDHFFIFARPGTWTYHNPVNPNHKGTIVVIENAQFQGGIYFDENGALYTGESETVR